MKLETDSSCFSAKPRRENDTLMSTNPWLIQRSLKAKNTTWKDLPKTRNDIQKQTKKITNRIHTWKHLRTSESSPDFKLSWKLSKLPPKNPSASSKKLPPLSADISSFFLLLSLLFFLRKPAVSCPLCRPKTLPPLQPQSPQTQLSHHVEPRENKNKNSKKSPGFRGSTRGYFILFYIIKL